MTAETKDFKGRLLVLIGEESVSSFGRKCQIGNSTLRKYLKGATPGLDKVIAIAEASNVNIEWLATGRGLKCLGDKDSSSSHVNQLEVPIIKEIKLWLRDMASDDPGWPAWFEIELSRKIPEFKEWRGKKQSDNNDQEVATG